MKRFFEFSKSQRKTLTLLGMLMLVLGSIKVFETYMPAETFHSSVARERPADEYRPPLTLDINFSPADSLELIPGIGPVLAKRIVEFRKERGYFVSIDSLIHVRGLGPVTLERIRPYFRNVTP